MTVKEIIDELKKQPPDALVRMDMSCLYGQVRIVIFDADEEVILRDN